MSPAAQFEPMEEIRRDVRQIRERMNDHDLLIRVNTILEQMSPKMDSIERLASLKADNSDLDSLAKRVEVLTEQMNNQRAYMNRMIGIGLAMQAFVTIIFGLLSLIHK